MDKRVIIICVLLIYARKPSPVEGNIISNLLNFITNRHDESFNRHKRITSDEGNKAVGLEARGFRSGEFNEVRENIDRRSIDKDFETFLNGETKVKDANAYKQMNTRSVLDDEDTELSGKTKILEQSVILTNKNKHSDDDERNKEVRTGRFEQVNSREEKEMSSVKTLSSLSVPATKNKGSGSGSGEDEDDTTLTEVFNWPKGRYALPKSIFGCPKTFGFRWKTGFRYHDTEDDGTENQRSDVFHLAANFSEDGISHEFCVKDDVEGEGEWPTGKYCIYKRGPLCPNGLKEGFVIWDDENTDNQNDKGGALPEGLYTEDTKIYFCCSTTGVTDTQISLPAKNPFFLFAYESIKCQKVLNMKVTSEFIKFDDEDHGNTDYEGGEYPYGIHKFQKDHMMFLCYYEPTKSVVSYDSEPALSTNLEDDNAQEHVDNSDIDQESVRQGEEMMKAFLKATGGVEDLSNKRERTKTIIKTIKVPMNSKGNPIAIVVGLVLGSFVIGTAIIFIAKVFVHKPSKKYKENNPKLENIETTWTAPNIENNACIPPISNEEANDTDAESLCSEQLSENNSIFTDNDSWSDFEEDEELVEDQLLPDSELKSGLELLFLKQQRHYWNQRRRHERGGNF